jgi:hypothetical protein
MKLGEIKLETKLDIHRVRWQMMDVPDLSSTF